jgi:hypothetical protein
MPDDRLNGHKTQWTTFGKNAEVIELGTDGAM